MKERYLCLVALALLVVPLSSACPYLECVNFSGQKYYDCRSIESEGFSEGDEQQLFCVLWEQEYGWEGYHPPEYPPLDPDLSLEWNEIDTSAFILALKIIMFLLFNYFLYSVLTKPRWVRKWLST